MRKKWTRVAKALLCLTLAASLLAGCTGGGGSSTSSGTSSSGDTSGTSSGTTETTDSNFNETGLPIVNEPVELTFLYVKGANLADLKENAMFKQIPTSSSTGSMPATLTGPSRNPCCWPAATCPTSSSAATP